MEGRSKPSYFLSPFAVFTVIALLKFELARYVIFGGWSLHGLLWAELPSVLLVFCCIELAARKRKLLAYMIVDLVLTAIVFAAIMYYKYYGVVVTYRALQQAGQATEVKASMVSLLQPYFLLVFVDIVILAALFAFYRPIRSWNRSHRPLPRRASAVALALCIFSVIVNVSLNQSIRNEIQQAKYMGIVNYEVFTVFSDVSRAYADQSPQPVIADEVEKIKHAGDVKEAFAGQAPSSYAGIAQGKNILVLQMESLQNFLINLTVDGQEITPNLNKLVRDSLYFNRIYQQVGQGNTSDAEYMLNTSLYIPPHGSASQTYANRELPGMPKVMKANGYYTATFHTNNVQFWNRQELYTALGFDKYYDNTFFGDGDTVAFGASDEVLYQKTSDELARLQAQGKPFYVNVISMSAHHPFQMPEDKKLIKLPEAFDGTLPGDYLVAQHYADYALGQFIDELKKKGLWDNTLLFLYGDHVGLPINSLTANEKKLLEGVTGREYDYRDMMNIPLVIGGGPVDRPKTVQTAGGHLDFMPTIAGLAGVSLKGQVRFGEDLLADGPHLLGERYYLPTGSFIDNEGIFVPGKGVDDALVLPFDRGAAAKPASSFQEEYDRALQLMEMSDHYVESLPKRSE